MGIRELLAFSLALGGCADQELGAAVAEGSTGAAEAESGIPEDAPDIPSDAENGCPARLLYDPLAGRLDAFPDELLTVDADTPTGLRVEIPRQGDIDPSMAAVLDAASTLDGAGLTAAAFLSFDSMLDVATLPAEMGRGASVQLVELGKTPRWLDFRWDIVAEPWDGGVHLLVLTPARPLKEATPHILLVTRGLQGEDGCIETSETMTQLLAGETSDALGRSARATDDALADRRRRSGVLARRPPLHDADRNGRKRGDR